MDDANNSGAKQQFVEKVTEAKHILVTVPISPSVDELSAAVGLCLLLDKLEKRPNVIFSGKIPPAISFLEPKKLFVQNIDGLRDFIIALDKEKADKLRWKVEDDIVKIYITPYKTVLNEKDLTFSQGDFNVELVIALGVEKTETLDKALQAQGKILHDATVISVNAGNKTSQVGSINWQDQSASSICEMLVGASEAFGSGLLDEQIATAFLTGIVANTNRFSNELTSPKVMTMSAQLMAAGANQQLIASNLGEPQELDEGSEANVKDAKNMPKKDDESNKDEVTLSHKPREVSRDRTTASTRPNPNAKIDIPQIKKPESDEIKEAPSLPTPAISVDKPTAGNAPEAEPISQPTEPTLEVVPPTVVNDGPVVQSHKQISEPPTYGGALNSMNSGQPDGSNATVDDILSSTSGDSLAHGDTGLSSTGPKVIPVPAGDIVGMSQDTPNLTMDEQIPDMNPVNSAPAQQPVDDALEQARQAVSDAMNSQPAAPIVPTPHTEGPSLPGVATVIEPMTAGGADNYQTPQAAPLQAQPMVPAPITVTPMPQPVTVNPMMPPALPPLPTDMNGTLPPLPPIQMPDMSQPQAQPMDAMPTQQSVAGQPPADPGTFPLPPMQ